MAKEIKHVGRIKNTGEKVAVVFRTVPGESDTALILRSSQLPDVYHDSLMDLIEKEQAQQTFELGEYMFQNRFPDGTNMLTQMQSTGRLQKVKTSDIEMTPTPVTAIALDELNALIAEQKNTTVDDLYTFVSGAPKASGDTAETVATATETVQPVEQTTQPANDGVLSDKDLAKSYRSQADGLYKEAARLRREADDLDPPAKKTTAKAKKEETESA